MQTPSLTRLSHNDSTKPRTPYELDRYKRGVFNLIFAKLQRRVQFEVTSVTNTSDGATLDIFVSNQQVHDPYATFAGAQLIVSLPTPCYEDGRKMEFEVYNERLSAREPTFCSFTVRLSHEQIEKMRVKDCFPDMGTATKRVRCDNV